MSMVLNPNNIDELDITCDEQFKVCAEVDFTGTTKVNFTVGVVSYGEGKRKKSTKDGFAGPSSSITRETLSVPCGNKYEVRMFFFSM